MHDVAVRQHEAGAAALSLAGTGTRPPSTAGLAYVEIHNGGADFLRRPDPKARTAKELAWLLTREEAALDSLLDTGTVEWKEQAAPPALDDAVAQFERYAAAVNERLDRTDETGWEAKGRFLTGEAGVREDSIGRFVRGFLFDEIHHGGQLSTCLRPMGGKVPSIYGPSADDPGRQPL